MLLELADWKKSGLFASQSALNALGALGSKAQAELSAIRALPREGPSPHDRFLPSIPRLLTDLIEGLENPSER